MNFDKSLVVLSSKRASIYIASFATIIGSPVGIASTSFSFVFSITTGIVKKYIKNYTKWKEEADKIVMLARNKLKSIENKIFKAFIGNEIMKLWRLWNNC